MTAFKAIDPDFRQRVRQSFYAQSIMDTIGAEIAAVEPGMVEILLPYRADLCQQNGFLHGGITTTIADSAAGYASFTLYAAEETILTSEFSVHLLAPAKGEHFRAVGRVLKAGRRQVVAEAEVFGETREKSVLIAKLIATLVRLPL